MFQALITGCCLCASQSSVLSCIRIKSTSSELPTIPLRNQIIQLETFELHFLEHLTLSFGQWTSEFCEHHNDRTLDILNSPLTNGKRWSGPFECCFFYCLGPSQRKFGTTTHVVVAKWKATGVTGFTP